ncbi:MAG: guanylate kinase [Candidatus Binatia bacterium]
MKGKVEDDSKREGIILILSAPSGTGKTTLINRLLALFPELSLSVSYTTRRRRGDEVAGKDYHFVPVQRFAAMQARGDFAEWAKVHDFLYGTPRKALDRCVKQGRDILLDIDVQGAEQIKKSYPGAMSIFLIPPSWQELRRRLASRGTDGPKIIARRMANAKREIRAIVGYDYYIVNRDVKHALAQLAVIIRAERLKVSRVTKWRIKPLYDITCHRSSRT